MSAAANSPLVLLEGRVLHEDRDILALDKPPGTLVIPGRIPASASLQEAAQRRFGRLWVVHRLDRGTSGVVVFARTAEAHRALCRAFEERRVEKQYLALVRGTPPEEARLDLPIMPGRRGRMRPAPPGDARGKEAATRVQRLELLGERGTLPAAALVLALPETGRTHQIRVHLAFTGTPLLFDPDYGRGGRGDEPLVRADGEVLLDRTPLHAARLVIHHPSTDERLTLEAPLPHDLQRTVEAYRG